jgi:hypothetical protein
VSSGSTIQRRQMDVLLNCSTQWVNCYALLMYSVSVIVSKVCDRAEKLACAAMRKELGFYSVSRAHRWWQRKVFHPQEKNGAVIDSLNLQFVWIKWTWDKHDFCSEMYTVSSIFRCSISESGSHSVIKCKGGKICTWLGPVE